LFRADFKETRRTELLIFLTPRIIRNEEEAELIKEIETQRINFIECEAEAMHGPLFGVPAEDPLGIPGTMNYGSPPESTNLEAVPPMPRRDSSSDDRDPPRGGTGGSPRMVPPDPGLDDGLSAVDAEPAARRRSPRAAANRAVTPETADEPAELEEGSRDSLVAAPAVDDYTDYPLTPVSGTVARKPAKSAGSADKSPASASRTTRGKTPRSVAK